MTTEATAPMLPVLTVIVPVYNEVQTIDELLRRVVSSRYNKQVIVVDDGSTDGTSEVLRSWSGHSQVDVLTHASNRGKGSSIRSGLEHAQGRFAVIQDADLEYDPADYPRLVEPLLNGDAQVVYGSRYVCSQSRRQGRRDLFRLGVELLNVAVRILYGVRLSDEATCYKALPTALLKEMKLECRRFEFCPEVTAKVCRMGISIQEVAICYNRRKKADGKKIRLRDGIEAMACLWKWRKWKPHDSRMTPITRLATPMSSDTLPARMR